MISSPDEAFVARLDRLERENRIVRWLAAAAFLVAIVLGGLPSGLLGRPPLDVQGLRLRDGTGQVRASLQMASDGSPSLAFFDAQGQECIRLESRVDECSLEFRNGGVTRSSLVSSIFGSTRLELAERWGHHRSTFFMQPEGTTGLVLDGVDRAFPTIAGSKDDPAIEHPLDRGEWPVSSGFDGADEMKPIRPAVPVQDRPAPTVAPQQTAEARS